MKCRCKSKEDMVHLGDDRRETDFDCTTYMVYWCRNCGRALKSSSHIPDWYEHNGLPKPKIVAVSKDMWCKCKGWKKGYKDLSPSGMKFCVFCGEQLTKTREAR